ncbi:STAS domain-containing protein [Streptomyces sp. NPDC046900]|uniref:STAS domain-containing protein n=1 Tax=Streptomyces sp. NPDC046900 TaxID=3155473 RepID=UPI0033C57982
MPTCEQETGPRLLRPSIVVQVHGEADVPTVPQIREHVVDLIEQGRRRLVVDLLGVTFIDSTGLGVLSILE